jgi:hypothetical protein
MRLKLKQLNEQGNQLNIVDSQLSQVNTELHLQLSQGDKDKQFDSYDYKINDILTTLEAQRDSHFQSVEQLRTHLLGIKERISGLGNVSKLYDLSKNTAYDIRRLHVVIKQDSLDKHLNIHRINDLVAQFEIAVQ